LNRQQPKPSWQGRSSWGVVDSDFDHGQVFLQAWLDWQQDPQAPRTLHVVACCPEPPEGSTLQDHADAALGPLAVQLAAQCYGLLPGFHRLRFAAGRVQLTLCIGEPLLALQQQRFVADSLHIQASSVTSPLHALKTLGRLSRLGSTLTVHGVPSRDDGAWQSALRTAGFVGTSSPAGPLEGPTTLRASYQPAWQDPAPVNSRFPHLGDALPIAVIGAGLAGASVAAVLARRGHLVDVYEAQAAPASGASGLPVGLLVAHVSRDDCPLSQLSRAGVRLTLQEAQNLLREGIDWSDQGVCQILPEADDPRPAHWQDMAQDWCSLLPPSDSDDTSQPMWALQHHPAAWIKPAALVRAWLAEPGVTLHANKQVAAIRRVADGWQLLDGPSQVMGHARQLVLANACDAQRLLQELAQADAEMDWGLAALPRTQGLRGLLSWAPHDNHEVVNWLRQAINGSGSLITQVPGGAGSAWYAGATYQDLDQAERSDQDNHRLNLAKLAALHPTAAAHGQALLEQGVLRAWKGVRCTTQDHLPLAGAVHPGSGLWLNCAMGSRGLSLAMLGAELLASHMHHEPLPVPWRLAQRLLPLRRKNHAIAVGKQQLNTE
jgi:tRNA 5-methylaminomethyl-2-thiouridine biosynthesis bifunctional protein